FPMPSSADAAPISASTFGCFDFNSSWMARSSSMSDSNSHHDDAIGIFTCCFVLGVRRGRNLRHPSSPRCSTRKCFRAPNMTPFTLLTVGSGPVRTSLPSSRAGGARLGCCSSNDIGGPLTPISYDSPQLSHAKVQFLGWDLRVLFRQQPSR